MTVRAKSFAFVTLAALAVCRPCAADISTWTVTGVDSGSGDTVSSSAQFTASGGTLTIVLTNTTAGGTLVKKDLLSGLVFSLTNHSSDPTLSISSTAMSSGSRLRQSNGTYTTGDNINGSYSIAQNPGGTLGTNTAVPPTTFNYEYGVSAVGASGIFPSPTLGGGGENYSIAATGTTYTGGGFTSSAFPLVENSVTIVLSGFGSFTASQISSVGFFYGSAPDSLNAGTHVSVPEPTGLRMLAIGLAVVAARRRFWARRSNRAMAG
jgi:hypothetical protein